MRIKTTYLFPAFIALLFMAYTREHISSGPIERNRNSKSLLLWKHIKMQPLIFLERIVNMNSGSMNFDGVRRVGDAFDAELANMGFSTEWIDGESFGRAGHLFATRGTKGPHFLLVGHLDTVFELDSPVSKL